METTLEISIAGFRVFSTIIFLHLIACSTLKPAWVTSFGIQRIDGKMRHKKLRVLYFFLATVAAVMLGFFSVKGFLTSLQYSSEYKFLSYESVQEISIIFAILSACLVQFFYSSAEMRVELDIKNYHLFFLTKITTMPDSGLAEIEKAMRKAASGDFSGLMNDDFGYRTYCLEYIPYWVFLDLAKAARSANKAG